MITLPQCFLITERRTSVIAQEIRNSMQLEHETQANLSRRVFDQEVATLVRQVSDTQASERQVLAAAEAAARVQHSTMDEFRQQVVNAQAYERQAERSAATIVEQLRSTLATKDESAAASFDRLREQLQHEATQTLEQRDQHTHTLKRHMQQLQDAARDREHQHATQLAARLDSMNAQASYRERQVTTEFKDVIAMVQT